MVVTTTTPSFPGAWPDLSCPDVSSLLLLQPSPSPSPSPSLSPSSSPPPPPDDISPFPSPRQSPRPSPSSSPSPSPKPLPELPSLSSSFSTTNSSVTDTSLVLPEPSCSPFEAQPACTPLSTHSPVLLNFREPHSPDSALFSPADDLISFPSPASSRLQLSLSNNCSRARSAESVATYLPSPSSPLTLNDEREVQQDEDNRPNLSGEERSPPCSRSETVGQASHSTQIAPIGKHTFMNKVKRFGGRVRKLFKARVVETKPQRNSVSSLVSPCKSSRPVSVRLPTPVPVPENATSRQDSEHSHYLSHRISLESLLPSRLARESVDNSSRTTTGDRLSTIISVHEEEWLSPRETRLPDAIR
ncbi:hypothetical protein B0F90DRAFT_1677526 [Multifurca ochricompacta]|uniref:Uncharacterized protein n=1 Tax=Multifurca ochricompacta TaxID=376703 RepID=A0AAD4MCY4_9AGAM|nr:hypothetical protein B0F90DRAFT_1677526 [Multifurca ochricompacta]